MHDAMQDDVTNVLYMTAFIALLLDGSDTQRHSIDEYAILLVFLGLALVACVKCSLVWCMWRVVMHRREQSSWILSYLQTLIPDCDWWAKRVVTFALDGASILGVRGASARQVVDVSTIENDVLAPIGIWLVPMTLMGEPCHVLQCKLGHALEAAGPTHVDYMVAVGRQRALYNGARQWKEFQKGVEDHVKRDKRSGLQLIPTSHRIR